MLSQENKLFLRSEADVELSTRNGFWFLLLPGDSICSCTWPARICLAWPARARTREPGIHNPLLPDGENEREGGERGVGVYRRAKASSA
jgi:hypothetical protein